MEQMSWWRGWKKHWQGLTLALKGLSTDASRLEQELKCLDEVHNGDVNDMLDRALPALRIQALDVVRAVDKLEELRTQRSA